MARIRLALLDKDVVYLQRTVAAFERSYHEKVEVHSFSDKSSLEAFLQEDYVDVLLVSDCFEISPNWSERAGVVAELTEYGEKMHEHAICKYQRMDTFYKGILSLQADMGGDAHLDEQQITPLVAVASVGGGTGATTVAMALCKKILQLGKKALYVNLEDFGTFQLANFHESSRSLSDVLFALKSKKGNLALKLESVIEEDDSGFSYINLCHSAADLLQLNKSEWQQLLQVLRDSALFDVVILDVTFSDVEKLGLLLQAVDKFLFVSTDQALSVEKTLKRYEWLQFQQQKTGGQYLDKLGLLMNQVSADFSTHNWAVVEMDCLGRLPWLSVEDEQEAVEGLASSVEMREVANHLLGVLHE